MLNYKNSGVNIEEGYKAVDLIKNHAKRTYIPGVLNGLGSFAGMFELGNYKNPVLVSGTDGVGTKLDIAFKMKKYDSVGIDCVAMCVNDILCHGAKPLFFLDYLACGKLEATVAEQLVKGVSDGCLQAGCALIGGETAEMPGFYRDGEYDIAGFSVGVAEKDRIIDGSDIKAGDALIGIEASGIHSNGYSLVRKLIKDIEEEYNGRPIGEKLLTPTKIYVKPILKLMESFDIKGMAHITGGGFYENIPRMFKDNYTAVVKKDSFPVLDIFKHLISLGADEKHMFNTFNMGIGFVLCIKNSEVKNVIEALVKLGLKAYNIGYVEAGGEGLCLE
ncbi:phosphoribosylformylglycinamidine cyclo-ligase [Candidatus Clostridium radicumherbarum]|uniref:Phosphoribosylformylglycinamidine cyclo-ligase n=1 Tax=Candidatus Clostridium radicumherbarum TaxID=3381662 RepID=A0ABW8TTY7_9CLOT